MCLFFQRKISIPEVKNVSQSKPITTTPKYRELTIVVLPVYIPASLQQQYELDGPYRKVITLVEEVVINAGIKTIDRQHLDQVIQELQLHQTALINKQSKIKLGKLLGANTLLQTSIDDIRIKNSHFKGYGTEVKTKEVTIVVSLSLVSVETGDKLFSTRRKSEPEQLMISEYGEMELNSDFTDELIEKTFLLIAANDGLRQFLKNHNRGKLRL
ncbi:MAG: hypothetical protein GY710_15305 [Desulfobacteraceae bacterium]|nr:hypothetical protein [Desulfobacteraceae bacterium]